MIERELGRGGMGAVYAVVHVEIGKRAALKVMHRRLVSKSAERMRLEAQVVNQVRHPNIVDIFETGTLADGRPYIVMERLDGVVLGERVAVHKLPPARVIDILIEVCRALHAAHAAGVVHRDLKVDNVFLLDDPDASAPPRIKLLDWGIAKVITRAGPRNTLDGQVVGTPQYLAPEQARGGAVTPRTDVYSLGVMAYELFVEQLPFDASTSAEIVAMHMRDAPPPMRKLWPDVPRRLDALVFAMLSKDPVARPSVAKVARELERARGELSPSWRPAEFAARSRWQFLLGAVALAASAMIFTLFRDGESLAAAARVPLADAPISAVAAEIAPTPVAAPPAAPSAVPASPAPARTPARPQRLTPTTKPSGVGTHTESHAAATSSWNARIARPRSLSSTSSPNKYALSPSTRPPARTLASAQRP